MESAVAEPLWLRSPGRRDRAWLVGYAFDWRVQKIASCFQQCAYHVSVGGFTIALHCQPGMTFHAGCRDDEELALVRALKLDRSGNAALRFIARLRGSVYQAFAAAPNAST